MSLDLAKLIFSTTQASGATLGVEFLAQVIEHVAHPIFVKDRASRLVLLNHAMATMTGFERDAMLGRTDHDFFPKEQADFFREIDRKVFESGESVEIQEEPMTDANGRLHVLSTTKMPLRDAQGEVTHLVGIIHDISALKHAEAALREANEQLESRVAERTARLAEAQHSLVQRERLAVIGRIAGSIAHQVRNPLGSIKNAAYLIHHAVGRPAEGDIARSISIIHDEVRRANQIISDLLEFTRVADPTRRAVPLDFIVEQCLAAFDFPAGVVVQRGVPLGLPAVFIDSQQVQRAVLHLLRNAVESMGEEGTLTVHGRAAGAMVVLGVEDTGVGVPEEFVQRLFEPMLNASHPSAMGLGLMTARALVENQGGSLECVASSPGRTLFEAALPIAAPAVTG
ncbi:MAG: PAS domain-containing protein [Myxococcales bacterium]|nr:PAS domain-containing protein [Myxococcales bacterium]